MKRSKVALLRCENYDIDNVYNTIKKGINLLGGIDSFIKPNEKILIKPNILAGRTPEKSITTHPAIFEAVLRLLLENNINLTYGDSPGFDKPSIALLKSGFAEIADKYKIKMADFDNGKTILFPEGVYGKKFEIANGVIDSDGIISLSKMKTHQLTRITGAIKNQFGCIYGMNKAAYHVTLPNATKFCKMLVDLNRLLRPRLYIMDGIVAMEGNGPASGESIKMNCILISNDPIAIDSTFCRIIGLNPEFVPTNTYGKETGFGNYEESEIEILGDNIESFINHNFNVIRKPIKDDSFLKPLIPFRDYLVARPVINKKLCVRCGICVSACPVDGKAIFLNNGKKHPPEYIYKKCIRCYCCQEVCPYKAISVKIPLLGKFFGAK
ncbi:MAG TPA: DUF362 domain-containing protein [Spirochaetota bacterium]|nr:DUF362 domain-containing protein [Spirochaetota bacterium]